MDTRVGWAYTLRSLGRHASHIVHSAPVETARMGGSWARGRPRASYTVSGAAGTHWRCVTCIRRVVVLSKGYPLNRITCESIPRNGRFGYHLGQVIYMKKRVLKGKYFGGSEPRWRRDKPLQPKLATNHRSMTPRFSVRFCIAVSLTNKICILSRSCPHRHWNCPVRLPHH